MKRSPHQGSSREAGQQSGEHAAILLAEKLAQRVESARLGFSQQHNRNAKDGDVPPLSQKESVSNQKSLPSQTLQYVLIVNNKIKCVEKDKNHFGKKTLKPLLP